ncbi:putative colanic acid biosynthesis acetyltransferase [Candidatus Nitrosacidococcus sp. I8]|uniref:putative colanic acid biosynthesis acetyltransferase n=1 Tax=Candidatus Nitrosacidococcus sp. I8 TaxID=2942908 RepID=UPI0024CAF4E6|nr:putative colanic acid biosynthesis acetyltransferase [Candidatus Nitrosacidococcus sp. I8]CAH9018349.1 hypothetical protein NURINAE_00874 [Candidatus Nitrosacidococcus sp. I8]
MPSEVQNLAKFHIPDHFRGKPAWFVQIWWLVESSLFRHSPQFMYGWRCYLLKLFGAKIGKNVKIRPTASITYPWKVSIGDNSWIGDETVLYSLGDIEIGSNTVISQRSYICTGSHDYKLPTFDIFARKITIESEVWVGTDVFIAPGVEIGFGTVVGARSSVFNTLPPMKICIGSPAKPITNRMST